MATDEQPGLAEFLRARLDEDAAAARDIIESEAGTAEWFELSSGVLVTGPPTHDDTWEGTHTIGDSRITRFIAEHDPARVLADVEAKRRIIGLHPAGSWATDEGKPFRRCGGEDWLEWPCLTLRLLALPYADHPAFKEEWKP